MRCGLIVYARPYSAAAPATVSGERLSFSHWETGKATWCRDPQARRPAMRDDNQARRRDGTGEMR